MTEPTKDEKAKQKATYQAVTTTYVFILLGFLCGLLLHYASNPIIQLGMTTVGLLFLSYDGIQLFIVSHIIQPFESIVESEKKQLSSEFNTEKTQRQQRTDFLAFMGERENLKYITWDVSLKNEDETQDKFEERLQERRDRFQGCQDAIQGLLKVGRIDQKTNKKILLLEIIANTASEKIVQDKASQDTIYKLLVLYLKAWLLCSIRYDTDQLPIEWINPENQSSQEIIEALKYIRTDILKDKRVKEYLSENAQAVVDEFLDKLINRLSTKKITLKNPT